MITLYTCGEMFGLPEASPYVTKTEIHLKMAGLAYVKEPAHPDLSPKGQLPWIDDHGALIADSHFIRLHLEAKYGFDFDAGLSEVERAQAWALERMIENHFGWTLAGVRWLVEENYAKGPARYFAGMPREAQAAIKQEVQSEVRARIHAVGIGRHTPEEILGLGERSLAALSLMLGDKRYFMGEEPTGVDAVAFGVLAGIMTPYFDAPIRDLAHATGTEFVDMKPSTSKVSSSSSAPGRVVPARWARNCCWSRIVW